MDEKLKLFVVGESSGNPDDWPGSGYGLVVARSKEEALTMSDWHIAAEVIFNKPVVLMAERQRGEFS